MRLVVVLGLVALAQLGQSSPTTDQLRQWILTNRRSIPSGAEEAISSASETDLASTILRIFGFGSEKKSTAAPEPTTTPKTGVKVSERDVCPFNADPLILSGEYAYCKPSNVGDCPVGFLCDQSFVLGRSICCQDLRNRPASINRPSGSSVRPPFNWNTVTPTSQPRWSPFTPTTRRAPWYIKDRTPWNSIYNRVTPETALITQSSTTSSTTTTTTTTTPTTTTTTTTAAPTTTTRPINPWARFWTSTVTPPSSVNVSVLQAGSIRPLNDNQFETVGAITLINDNGLHVLVDTGASSDTERLLQSLSKEAVTLDDIDTVVITHGHPGHMGNMNFFGQKPILFHSMEYIGRHVTPTELRDRPYRKLSANVEVWKTPGHTQHDLSVLVHNVAGYGSMAIVGDLIPTEALVVEKVDAMAEEGVWDSAIKRQNANLIICMADWVVPGHGQPFRVLPQYRQKAGCTRLLAQRHLLNN